jgi:serine/threonine protein kinase
VIGRLINQRYEVLERLGEGAIFQVFKARDKVSSRIITIKTLQSTYAQDPVFCNALRNTLKDIPTLTHPNIARVEEIGEEDGSPFLVTEFVRGINLKERIRRIAPFTLSVAVDFAIAIGEALQQAHGQGIFHGDLRPHNVIISPEGALKVTDFGLARALATSQEAAGSNMGRSVHYQAPELAAGAMPTVATDIYSLGVMLFEMLTGGLPYPGETPLVVAMKHQNDPVPSPRGLNPGVPRSLEGIVMKSLLKHPDDRYRSTVEMLTDLKSVRDALRFGKPLSWSPMENDRLPGPAAAAATATYPTLEPVSTSVDTRRPEPLPEPTPVTGAARMSSTAASDDRISPYIKVALGTVIFILLTVGIAGIAIWMATFAKPLEQTFPKLVGMRLEDAERTAGKANIRLMDHEEFSEKYDPGVILRVDPDLTGKPVRAGRSINVWVSKGSRLVYVPDLTNLQKDEAETKLKAAGLTLGSVDRANNNKINFDYVITQNPRPRKRVNRDLAVNLIISDGPKADENTQPLTDGTTNPDNPNPDNANGGGTNSGNIAGNDSGSGTGDTNPRSINLSKRIPRDGRGARRVRIEYDDSQGTHQAVDEYHDEGETVTTKVNVVGSKITVRVYYGEDSKPISEKTQTLPRNP